MWLQATCISCKWLAFFASGLHYLGGCGALQIVQLAPLALLVIAQNAQYPRTSEPEVQTGHSSEQAQAGAPSTEAVSEPTSSVEVVVAKDRRALGASERGASDVVLSRALLEAAPRSEGAEMLRSAPGLYLGRGEGGSVAHNYVLRGFDSEHGQDIDFKVGGLPVNLPSHIHGQGYSDLGFLIGDVVDELSVRPGVYDPGQGDFAVAGSIGVSLGVAPKHRGLTLRSGYGRWGRFDQLMMWAPKEGSKESFGALNYSRTNGFGQNRGGSSASAILQHRIVAQDWSLRLLGILHSARHNLAGVLRHDDVQDGRVRHTDVYPLATARAQNAMAQRLMWGTFSTYQGDEGQFGEVDAWMSVDTFRIQQNFTGFIEQSQTLNRVGGRGDLIEQRNRTLSFGMAGRYTSRTFRPFSRVSALYRVGVEGRLDLVEQAQSLLDAAVRNQTWDRRVEAEIRGVDLGGYAELSAKFADSVKVSMGMRADALSYEIDDKLGNFAPTTRPKDQFIVGFRRSAQGLTVGPRGSLHYWPHPRLAIKAAYGQGYRSPQARQLVDGEDAPFTKVHSADLGLAFDAGVRLKFSTSGYFTYLSDDVAFDASEGRLERTGASRRLGATLHAQHFLNRWLTASFSATYVHATLIEPPPPTAQDPVPIFEKGQHLPYVPPLVLRGDLGANGALVSGLKGGDLRGGLGLGVSFLSPRPLPYGVWADPVTLLDLSAHLAWNRFRVGVELFNLLNAKYAAVEYSFASDWRPNHGVRPRVPARHRSAGAPFSWFASLGFQL